MENNEKSVQLAFRKTTLRILNEEEAKIVHGAGNIVTGSTTCTEVCCVNYANNLG
jgi:hypothetical protein